VLHLPETGRGAENEANYLPPVQNVTVHMTIPEGMKVPVGSPTFLDTRSAGGQSGRDLGLRFLPAWRRPGESSSSSKVSTPMKIVIGEVNHGTNRTQLERLSPRKYPTIGVCGLDCGLVPEYYTPRDIEMSWMWRS